MAKSILCSASPSLFQSFGLEHRNSQSSFLCSNTLLHSPEFPEVRNKDGEGITGAAHFAKCVGAKLEQSKILLNSIETENNLDGQLEEAETTRRCDWNCVCARGKRQQYCKSRLGHEIFRAERKCSGQDPMGRAEKADLCVGNGIKWKNC